VIVTCAVIGGGGGDGGGGGETIGGVGADGAPPGVEPPQAVAIARISTSVLVLHARIPQAFDRLSMGTPLRDPQSMPRRLTVPSLVMTMGLMAMGGGAAWAQQPGAPDRRDTPAREADAQAHAGHGAADEGWRLSVDGVAFFGYNYQKRAFTDFDEVESQNWFMASAQRRAGTTSVTLLSMFSLEPFTMRDLGSPQVFQTGETFEGAPLIDYQHPHDLVMALGGRVERRFGAVTGRFEASLVGTPALGPEPFMHRPSAADNPQVPLSHHGLDSTHISSDVLTGRVSWQGLAFDASWFHGREPDENRLDLDQGVPDSWSARVSWSAGPWQVQASGGHLNQPEWVHPYDETRLSASVAWNGEPRARPLSVLVAWGQKREPFGDFDAYLLEAHFRVRERDAFFTRLESVTKAILGGGLHPPGFQHYHPHSRIGAATAGYVRDLVANRRGRLGLGADVTVYRTPLNLRENYGRPLSFHVFVRYAAPRPASSVGHH
jgi:hypothetical protein